MTDERLHQQHHSPDPDEPQLLGVIWPLGDVVQLDKTVDRLRLRQQKTRLMELSYAWQFKTQSYIKQ